LLSFAVGLAIAHEGHAPLPSKGSKVDPQRGLITLSSEARTALDVQTREIGTAAPPETILAYATLETPWKQHAFAVSRLPGQIVSLRAKPGDRVEIDQVLAEVQSQELETLQLEIGIGLNEVNLAEKVLAGLKETPGTVPSRDIDAADIQLRQLRNTLDLAKLKWRALGISPEALDGVLKGIVKSAPTLPIRSPVAGTVVHADLAVGKMVEPGEHLFEIVDLSTVWARIGVLEKDVARVAAGLPVVVQLTSYPGESFRGTVAIVGLYLDPITHLNDVWVEFRNPSGFEPRMLPGMTGQARIELPIAAGTKTVPSTALVNDGVDRFVLVEEANATGQSELRRRSVEVVRELPDSVEVRSPDLFPGDRVVTRGGHELGVFFAPDVLRLTPQSSRSIGLAVEPASLRSVDSVVEIPGSIDLPPERRSVATARLPGILASIRIDRGQKVKTGDVLAEVFSLELLKLQLDLLQEHLAAELTGQQLAQLQDAKDAIPKRRVIEAEAALSAARNRRDSLRRRLELVGLTSGQLDALVRDRAIVPTLPVRAAVAGTIVAFDRIVGQSVRADEALFEIHDLVRPWIQGFVSEQELARVKIGQDARVRVIGNPGAVLTGKVVRSGRTFGGANRTLSIWVEFDADPPTALRQSQIARLALAVETRPAALAVPLGAIVREGTRTYIFVKTGELFDRREVVLGPRDDRYAEVKSGLKIGESIAVTAAEELNTAWASVR